MIYELVDIHGTPLRRFDNLADGISALRKYCKRFPYDSPYIALLVFSDIDWKRVGTYTCSALGNLNYFNGNAEAPAPGKIEITLDRDTLVTLMEVSEGNVEEYVLKIILEKLDTIDSVFPD